MQQKNTLSIIFALFLALNSVSQSKKGDAYYEQKEYTKAIPHYQKETRSKTPEQRQAGFVKLGNCYKALNDNKKAEAAYAQAVSIENALAPDVYYNYAQVLKVNAKYEEAAEQYEQYIRLSPNDENAKNAMKFCREIKYYLSRPIEYTVKNTETINTSQAEFSPFVINNKLVFIAERTSFDFSNYSVIDYDGQPYLNMYVSNIAGSEVKKSKTFSKNVNSDYHEGPACVSADGQTLYFTRVSPEKQGITNNAKIFTATGSGRSWKNIKPLPINSDDFSIAHPSISADNTMLFFTSNMPGGMGGKDIWMCTRSADSWSQPVNLGPDINTSGDEMFPTLKANGVLYFSSNGLPGFGGLDIYSAKKLENKWILNRNEGMSLNSNGDDFGITFLNDSTGYFSSNRAGGKGKDDIYQFTFANKSLVVSGTVLLTENLKDYAGQRKVLLMDEQGNVVDSTSTNAKGYFEFKNLAGDKKYMAVIEEADPQFTGKARFYLSEKDSVIHRVAGKYGDNRFAFKNLPIDPNGLPDLYTSDDLVFAGALMTGPTGTTALANAKLKLVNDFGDVVEETTTNEVGAFAFRNIPADQNYLISVEESDVELPEGTKITLNSKSGKAVKTFYKTKGKFSFKVLTTDKNVLEEMDAEDVNLVMGLYGYMYDQDKRPIMNAKIRVKHEDGSNVQEFVTTEKGKFNFKNLDAEREYLFEADETDPNLAGVKRIFIADSKGRIYKVIDLIGGKFSFKLLEVDKVAMGEFVIDDPALRIEELKKKKEKELLAKNEPAPVKEPVVKKKKEPKTKAPKETKEVVKEETAVAEPVKTEEPVEEESELTIVIVENIYYAYGDYKLDAAGQAILDKAVAALKDTPSLVMEISSHTDSQSSSGFNLGLSNRRAQTAVDYLVKQGVDRTRLKPRGFGETKLLNKCADGVECTEDEHKVNRRTEFKITKPIKR